MDKYPQSDAVVTKIIEVICLALTCGESVNIRNFGKFEPRTREPVTRKNPRTGTLVDVPRRHSVGFVPAPALRDRMNKGE